MTDWNYTYIHTISKGVLLLRRKNIIVHFIIANNSQRNTGVVFTWGLLQLTAERIRLYSYM